MLRGNERKDIFIDKQDKGKFIKIVFKKKADKAFKLYAYCIMNNHLHLVIKEQKEPISQIIKKIANSYAYYFNRKFDLPTKVKIEFFEKEDSYFNWSKSGKGKKSVRRTVPLTTYSKNIDKK